MICADEWNRLFSALEIFKIGFIGVPSNITFFRESVWLTCLDIYSRVRLKSCVLCLFYPPVFVDFI